VRCKICDTWYLVSSMSLRVLQSDLSNHYRYYKDAETSARSSKHCHILCEFVSHNTCCLLRVLTIYKCPYEHGGATLPQSENRAKQELMAIRSGGDCTRHKYLRTPVPSLEYSKHSILHKFAKLLPSLKMSGTCAGQLLYAQRLERNSLFFSPRRSSEH
jgi:hypothetical protein